MATPPHPPSTHESPAAKVVLAACLLAGFAILVDQNMTGVALPTVESTLHLTGSDAAWATAGYTLPLALSLIVGGRLGDDYGRRRVLLVSLTFFIIATASGVAASTAVWLIAARVCAGFCAGLASPQIVGLIQQSFDGHRRGRAYGFYSATVSLSAVVGPLLGGALISKVGPAGGWRLAFAVSPVIALVAIVFAYHVLPRDTTAIRRGPLDLVGIVLLGLCTLTIMLPITEAAGSGSRPTWSLLAAGIVLLTVFWFWERRMGRRERRPLLPMKVLGRRNYVIGVATVTCFFAGYPGVLLLVQFYLQQGRHYSALTAAASTMVFGIGSSIGAIVGGRLVPRSGRWIVVVGCTAVTGGVGVTALLMTTGSHGGAALILSGPFLVAGLGSGLIMSPNQTLAMADISRSEGSTAAGVYQTGMRLGQSIGLPLALALYTTGLHHWHGDVPRAGALGLLGSSAFIGLALIVRLVDVIRKEPYRDWRLAASGPP